MKEIKKTGVCIYIAEDEREVEELRKKTPKEGVKYRAFFAQGSQGSLAEYDFLPDNASFLG